MTEEMKKELAFTEEELKELEQFYQFPKPFYQLSKFLNFDTKIRGKKLLPTKGLVNSNADIAQTSINPGPLLKVRKTDECISEVCLVILNEEPPVNGVGMPFTGVF